MASELTAPLVDPVGRGLHVVLGEPEGGEVEPLPGPDRRRRGQPVFDPHRRRGAEAAVAVEDQGRLVVDAVRHPTTVPCPMPKKEADDEVLRRKERVVAATDMPGIPE